jgi:cytochrome c-type biogenesis protein CcmH/NrfG
MNNTELQQQYELCQKINDADQWDYLAQLYFARGYPLNAVQCFRKADEIRGCSFAEAVPEVMLLAEARA